MGRPQGPTSVETPVFGEVFNAAGSTREPRSSSSELVSQGLPDMPDAEGETRTSHRKGGLSYNGAKVYPEGMGNAHDKPREGRVDAHSASGNDMGNTHSAPGEEVGNTHSAPGKGVEITQSTPGEGMGTPPGFTVYRSLPGMHLL